MLRLSVSEWSDGKGSQYGAGKISLVELQRDTTMHLQRLSHQMRLDPVRTLSRSPRKKTRQYMPKELSLRLFSPSIRWVIIV